MKGPLRLVFCVLGRPSGPAALLPARYTAWQLPPWWRKKVSNDFYGMTAFFHFAPFSGLPDTAQMARPIFRNFPTYSHQVTGPPWHSSGETWQITALGCLTGQGVFGSPWEMHPPPASITDHLFKPASSGGLGLDPETFFDQNFTPKPLEHYPELDTPTGWCADDGTSCGR